MGEENLLKNEIMKELVLGRYNNVSEEESSTGESVLNVLSKNTKIQSP